MRRRNGSNRSIRLRSLMSKAFGLTDTIQVQFLSEALIQRYNMTPDEIARAMDDDSEHNAMDAMGRMTGVLRNCTIIVQSTGDGDIVRIPINDPNLQAFAESQNEMLKPGDDPNIILMPVSIEFYDGHTYDSLVGPRDVETWLNEGSTVIKVFNPVEISPKDISFSGRTKITSMSHPLHDDLQKAGWSLYEGGFYHTLADYMKGPDPDGNWDHMFDGPE